MNILRLLAVWFGLVIGAILNGTFRQFVLIPQFGDATAHILSSVMLSGINLLVAHVTFPLLRINSPLAAWKAGLFWLTMTLLFEFGFGHFIMGKPWSLLLEDYNVMAGRIWILILIVAVSAPRIILQLRKG